MFAARNFLSRATANTLRKPVVNVPRVTAFQSLKIQQKNYSSGGTKDYTVREALNEALGMLFLGIAELCWAPPLMTSASRGIGERRESIYYG